MSLSPKQSWQELARQIQEFHLSKIKENRDWNVRDTAKAINRGIGPTSEYLMLAGWLKVVPDLKQVKNLTDALKFVRSQRDKLRLEGL